MMSRGRAVVRSLVIALVALDAGCATDAPTEDACPDGGVQVEADCVDRGPTEVSGCTDPEASNYDPEATQDDGSCSYESLPTLPFVVDDFSTPSFFAGDPVDASVPCEVRGGEERGRCHRFTYVAGSMGFAQVFWQFPPGDFMEPGFSIPAGANAVSFYAWGADGGEVVDFIAGQAGVDSFNAAVAVTLTPTPQRYLIALENVDYTNGNVLAPFGWSATLESGSITVYIDDIAWEIDIAGCTDPDASNYDPAATQDDGSCVYESDVIVFADDYGANVSLTPFTDVINSLTVDTNEARIGAASLRIEVPSAGYTGGALVADLPADLSAYDAITFWVRADEERTLDVVGIGNDAQDAAYNTEIAGGIELTTDWAKYIVPIPDPSMLTASRGLFHFAEGSNEGAYTVWFDEIRYTVLDPDVVTNPRPAIASETQMGLVGETFTVGGNSVVYEIDGIDLTLDPCGQAFFTYDSSDENVAIVSGPGTAEASGVGTAGITAKLRGVPADGVLTLEITLPPEDCGAAMSSSTADLAGNVTVSPMSGPSGTSVLVSAPVTAGTREVLVDFAVTGISATIGGGFAATSGAETITIGFTASPQQGDPPGIYPAIIEIFGTDLNQSVFYITADDGLAVERSTRSGNTFSDPVPQPNCTPPLFTLTE